MKTEIQIDSQVKHESGFEGVVVELSSSYVKVLITKGSHKNASSNGTYTAHRSYLTVIEKVEKPLQVGSYVVHTRYGFKGVVETLDTFNARVGRITEGVHPFESGKKTYDASPALLKVIESPQEHFEKLLKEYKAKVDKANAEAKEAKAKADELAKDDANNVMEIEMNGMKIKTDYRTFKKMIADFSK